MAFSVVFIVDAEIDLQEAFNWYEEQRKGLGESFLLSVEASIEKIKRAPFSRQIRINNVRKAVLNKFPYLIAYTIMEQQIVVLAIHHASRFPKQFYARGF